MFLDISERIHKDLVKIAPIDNVMKIDCASNHEQYTRVGGFRYAVICLISKSVFGMTQRKFDLCISATVSRSHGTAIGAPNEEMHTSTELTQKPFHHSDQQARDSPGALLKHSRHSGGQSTLSMDCPKASPCQLCFKRR